MAMVLEKASKQRKIQAKLYLKGNAKYWQRTNKGHQRTSSYDYTKECSLFLAVITRVVYCI